VCLVKVGVAFVLQVSASQHHFNRRARVVCGGVFGAGLMKIFGRGVKVGLDATRLANKTHIRRMCVLFERWAGPPGLEPGKSVLETDSLPLAYGPKRCVHVSCIRALGIGAAGLCLSREAVWSVCSCAVCPHTKCKRIPTAPPHTKRNTIVSRLEKSMPRCAMFGKAW
jgi:hypothetical protein